MVILLLCLEVNTDPACIKYKHAHMLAFSAGTAYSTIKNNKCLLVHPFMSIQHTKTNNSVDKRRFSNFQTSYYIYFRWIACKRMSNELRCMMQEKEYAYCTSRLLSLTAFQSDCCQFSSYGNTTGSS